MSFKRASQLAVLSILLTFTNSIAYANPSVPSSVVQLEQVDFVSPRSEENVSAQTVSFWSRFFRGKRHHRKEDHSREKQRREKVRRNVKSRRAAFSTASFLPTLSKGKEPALTRVTKKRSIGSQHKMAVSSSAVISSKPASKVLSVSGAEVEVSLEERDRLISEWLKEKRAGTRKSSRTSLAAKSSTGKIRRDGSVTSMLRYDVEKAASVKAKRNRTVAPELKAQRSSVSKTYAGKNKVSSDQKESQAQLARLAVEKVKEEGTSAGQPAPEEKKEEADRYFSIASSAENTNVNSYLDAKQYRCSSEETDWPCSSCVAKRRAHSGISVCTMVVSVIALILAATIICNASADSAPSSSPGSGS